MSGYIAVVFLFGLTAYVSAACGISNVNRGRIIAGTDAKQGSWPWQVLLRINGQRDCGGTLISPNWVVTVAHCIYENPFYVVLGELDVNQTSGFEKKFNVSRVIIHPKYNDTNLDFDFALLKLSRPAKLSKNVQPACLPDRDAPIGLQCYITGWGFTSYPGKMNHLLQQAPMKVIDSHKCQKKSFGDWEGGITDSMICGGGEGKISACLGDSGSPFVCRVNNRWELHGAVSFGTSYCDSSTTYSVCGRISAVRPWIRQETNV